MEGVHDRSRQFPNAKQLRELFAVICALSAPSDPSALWSDFKAELCEDYSRDHTPRDCLNRALWDIQGVLGTHNTTCKKIGLPTPKAPTGGETRYDPAIEADLCIGLRLQLNSEQEAIVTEVLNAVEDTSPPQQYFLDGPGGTGKTFLYKALCHILRGRSQSVIPVARTGIAANLLPGRRTTHSAFKFPLHINETSTSTITPNSLNAGRLRDAALIKRNEASTVPRSALAVLNRLLQDITGFSVPFGGKTILLGGHFRQVLPVVRRGSRTTTVECCLKRSPLWKTFENRKLSKNMRAGLGEEEFCDWLLRLGNGTLPRLKKPTENTIELPEQCVFDDSLEALVKDVYGTDLTEDNILACAARAILCPKNENCDRVNEYIVEEVLKGQSKSYFSVTNIASDDEAERSNYPQEFLNSLSPSGLPPHVLMLPPGAIVILIRNLSGKSELVNGTRMVIRKLHENCIDAEVISGEIRGSRVLLPRIRLTNDDPTIPFSMRRKQFPVRLAFAMTINKAQDQTFEKIGIYLPQPVFAHGQLYVAFSRVSSLNSVHIKVENTTRQGRLRGKKGTYTSNIVFPEVLH